MDRSASCALQPPPKAVRGSELSQTQNSLQFQLGNQRELTETGLLKVWEASRETRSFAGNRSKIVVSCRRNAFREPKVTSLGFTWDAEFALWGALGIAWAALWASARPP